MAIGNSLPRHKYKVGDLVIVVSSVNPKYDFTIGWVISIKSTGRNHKDLTYNFDIEVKGMYFVEHELVPYIPPEKGSWENCIWKPEGINAGA